MSMKLYGVPLSPFVRKVMFTLGELNLAHEPIEVSPGSDDPAFRQTSPSGQIPGFVDGDFQIADSAAICRYLVTRERSELMGGSGPQRQARIVQWETFGDDDIGPALMHPLIERVVKPVRLGQPTDDGPVRVAVAEKLPRVFARIEVSLAARGPWLMGEAFSYADIAIGAHMATAALADVLPTPSDYPRLAEWFDAVQMRPAYRAMMDQANRYITEQRNT